MKKKNTPFYILVIALLFINGYYYMLPYFTNSNQNLEKVNSEISLNSEELVANFISNEDDANELYAGKIIEVVGFVKEVTFLNNRNTVILYSKNKTSGIICDVHSSQLQKVKKLETNQKIKVKGICKGFLKDVVLLNCHIEIYE
ncbi:MAG: hypothetical protein V3V28_07775 [Polaribacter sp.]|uniref:OB-fold protein n=1 Tax=Polaribacter sp. TaxID=1920175 RepID=UPI002F35BE93